MSMNKNRKINVLDKSIAELIAAGEVVERPSSVIKELLENSIDAGASVVTVEIRGGGVKFMRVTDNGAGIPKEDVPTAFLRHATSKIQQKDDLDSIMTLGFRGEALASISAVSHLELLTKTADEPNGTRYVSSGSDDYELEEAGCPKGTTIIIRDLFFNVPARMKFLKKDVTEGNSIAGIVDKIALSHPEVSIRFIRDSKEVLHTSGDSKLSSAIYAVYGKEFYSSLIPVDYTYNNVKVSGYISSPSAARPNKSMQNFFINGRFIKSRTAGAALDEAFKGSLMTGKFAACVLRLELSFEAVDVNVHPAKLEVRFVNEKPIFEAVYHGVKSALAKGDTTKTMEFKKPAPLPFAPAEKSVQTAINLDKVAKDKIAEPTSSVEVKQMPPKTRKLADASPQSVSKPSSVEQFYSKIEKVIDSSLVADSKIVDESDENVETDKNEIIEPKVNDDIILLDDSKIKTTKLIGEAFSTYIIIEYAGDSLMLIDKHAAHERLIYEKLKDEEVGTEAQTLLEPVLVTLDKSEHAAVLNNLSLLEEAGFEVEDFGSGKVLVRTAPLILNGGDVADALMEIAGYISGFKTNLTTEHLDWVYHNVACRAAMKSGDKSTDDECIALAKELDENPDVRYCPHGRPVSIIIKRRDLERQFGRI